MGSLTHEPLDDRVHDHARNRVGMKMWPVEQLTIKNQHVALLAKPDRTAEDFLIEFLVNDVPGLYARLMADGYGSNFPPITVEGVTEMVAQLKGPEGYAIEISRFATDLSFCIALGIGVADGPVAESFYVNALT